MGIEEEFERDVRRALVRVDAPAGFSERVLARTRQRRKGGAVARFTAPAWRAGYAAAALLAIVAGSVHVQHVRETERRAAEAQQQFARAMTLTDHALDRVAVQLQKSQIGLFTASSENRSGE